MWDRLKTFFDVWWSHGDGHLSLRVWLRWVATGSVGCALLALACCAPPAIPPTATAPLPEKRFLTKQQDEQIGRACVTGCAIVPRDTWLEQLRRNHQMGV